ncbi:hypothetical protein BC940DRAFT_325684 [Gongronella butleri]|nr:hypothetical protein BC940DRAFT_325684 [Gongronella butleri]
MFGEPSPDHPLEAQLRVEAQNYVDQLSLAKRDLGRFKEVDQTLVQALRQGRKLRDLIAVTLDYAPFDLFGGPMMDPQQMAYVEMCQRTTWDIQRRLNHVRQTLPEIPYPASLDVVTNNPLVSLRLDSNYVDVAWKMKTQQGFQRVAAGEKAVQAALHWVRQYLRYTEGAIERLKEASETTQTSLLQERRRIIDKILRQEPAVDGPLFDGDEADLPPPPLYEAPQNEEQTAPINPLIPLDIPTTMDNHLALPSPTSARNSLHIRTASQSSSIMDARPTQPPDRPAPPSPTAPNASLATDGHDHNPFRHPPQ